MAYVVRTGTADPPAGDQVGVLLKRVGRFAWAYPNYVIPPQSLADPPESVPVVGQIWPRGNW